MAIKRKGHPNDRVVPCNIDDETLKNYYEMEAASCAKQESMYCSEPWISYWHMTRRSHVCDALAALDGTSFLDVGCCEGMYMIFFQSVHPDARRVGLDISQGYLDRASSLDPDAKYVRGDAASLPFEDRSFDIVLCSETMEHVPDPEKVFAELSRVSAKNIIVTVPGYTVVRHLLKKLGLAPELDRKGTFAEPERGHLHELWVADLVRMGKNNGFKTEKVVVDSYVPVALAKKLKMSHRTIRRLNSLLGHLPGGKNYGLVQMVVFSRVKP